MSKAILVIDTDEKIIEKLSKINVSDMCVDIGFDYHLDCNGRGGWCFHRPKSLLSIKPLPQKKVPNGSDIFNDYVRGYNDCIDEIFGVENE